MLYGFDTAKNAIRKADCILLVEGQFDLIMCHQSGLPFTVAVSGTALTPEHLSLLGRLSKRLVLALDGDAAGIRAGRKSALMALAGGFDVKIPAFPNDKDPADIVKENPELLKEAVRASKTAVEFFLDFLRLPAQAGAQSKDERAYKKAVEAQVLPLIKVLPSRIDQEHFTRLVAGRLLVSEEAVRAEVARLPAYNPDAFAGTSSEPQDAVSVSTSTLASSVSHPDAEEDVSSTEKKALMLLVSFPVDSKTFTRLAELVGKERMEELQKKSEAQTEYWHFMFERELGEHTSPEIIAEDMLADIKRATEKEMFKRKFL